MPHFLNVETTSSSTYLGGNRLCPVARENVQPYPFILTVSISTHTPNHASTTFSQRRRSGPEGREQHLGLDKEREANFRSGSEMGVGVQVSEGARKCWETFKTNKQKKKKGNSASNR